MHVFREHNQEADHWANVGAEGQRKVVIDRQGFADTWKAVKGFGDASCNDNGESGCGVVIKGVDREGCTISKIALPLKSWYSYGGRNDGCVRAHWNPGSGFPHMSVRAEYQPMYCHNYEETVMCLVVVCKRKNADQGGLSKVHRCEQLPLGQTCFATRRFQLSRHFVGLLPAFADNFTKAFGCSLWRSWGDPREAPRFVLKRGCFGSFFHRNAGRLYPCGQVKSRSEQRKKGWTWQQTEHRYVACEGMYTE